MQLKKMTMRALPYALPNYPDALAALLHARGVNTIEEANQFLHPSLDQLHDPFLLHDMKEACGLVRKAVADKTPIAVYGDYDADGVCATAILKETLASLGARVISYIPNRQTEGYGFNADAVKQLAQNAGLLISVDCGVTAVTETQLAKSLGMGVIITDHHTLPESLPPADAIIHPRVGGYPFPDLCGAGIAFKLSCALLGLKNSLDYLDLACVGTIADLVPLTGENRVIAALGLRALAETKRPGLVALMKTAGIPLGAPVSSDKLAFQIAPRLNAGGRLESAEAALDLLLTRDETRALETAETLDALNRERRDLQELMVREARGMVSTLDLRALRSLVVAKEGWNTGVAGLVAGKLAECWNYPAIVLCVSGEECTGSGRSACGIDLYAAVAACGDLLTRFGGHRMAAGLTLPLNKLEAFKARFDAAVQSQLGEDDLFPEIICDCPLPLKSADLSLISLLEQLAPYGMGNPSPLFLFEDVKLLSARAVGRDAAHLKVSVSRDSTKKDGIAFRQGSAVAGTGQKVSLVACVEKNAFNGQVTAQLVIKNILPGEDAFIADPQREAMSVIKTLQACALANMEHIPVEPICEIGEARGTRGTLFAARCAETANELARRFPGLDVCLGTADDPRGFHALVLSPDWQRPFAKFDRVILADGMVDEREAALILSASGAQQVLAMPGSAALRDLLHAMALSKDALRQAYARLREGKGERLTPSPAGDVAALCILSELNLIRLDENLRFSDMMPMTRRDPEESALYRALHPE